MILKDMKLYQINKAVKRYRPTLFAKRDDQGRIVVMQKRYRFRHFDLNGSRLLYSTPNHEVVMYLTTNWQSSGLPAEWGQGPVIDRLKQIDPIETDILGEIEKKEERAKASKKRALKTACEGMAEEWRPYFKKATSDINTSLMDKTDSRKKKDFRMEAKFNGSNQ